MTGQQYPTREQIAVDLIEKLRQTQGEPIDLIWQRWQRLFRKYDDAVLALFPQPTPSAEPTEVAEAWDEGFEAGATWPQHTPSGVPVDPPRNPYEVERSGFAAPPNIAAMAPGTTFRGQHVQGAGLDTREVLWTVDRATDPHGPLVESETGTWRYTTVDRSTIRDVQDPPATPEAD